MADLLLQRVRTFLDHHHLLRSDARLLVAVSGGPDSLCLLHLLRRLHAEGGPALHVAHLDHGFRGAESAGEAAFVARVADRWGLPATVERIDVPAIIARTAANPQATARAVRYAFLARVARAAAAVAVAVAHQADDQAETVLMHLLRGAGPAGLRGMRPVVPWEEWALASTSEASALVRAGGGDAQAVDTSPVPGAAEPPLIRPLLDSSRAEIEDYCAAHGLEPRRDPSNHAHYYARNRLRDELLPILARYNPQIVAALGRTARVCADDYAYLQAQLDACWPALAEVQPARVILSRPAFAALPVALARYALRRAAALLLSADDLSFQSIEDARAAAIGPAGQRCELGRGLWLLTTADQLVLCSGPPPALDLDAPAAGHAYPQLAAAELPVAVPGATALNGGWRLIAGFTPVAGVAPPWSVTLDADALAGPLALRRRRPGDRFRPAGGRGSRLIQDFFVDRKLPRALRAAWPLLATPTAIAWVAGMRADERFIARETTRNPIWIALVHEPEPG